MYFPVRPTLILLCACLSLAALPLAAVAEAHEIVAIARRSLQGAYPRVPTPSRATFYGGPNGEDTFNGACGYAGAYTQVGLMSAAASVTFFANGTLCGACYRVLLFHCPAHYFSTSTALYSTVQFSRIVSRHTSAAASVALFANGTICGACYRVHLVHRPAR